MPIYIYRCTNCGVQFERHQSFSDEPLKRCPECSKNSLKKVYTPAGIVFKGSGWYATDNKSSSGASSHSRSENKEPVKTEKKTQSGETESASSAGSSPAATTPPAAPPARSESTSSKENS